MRSEGSSRRRPTSGSLWCAGTRGRSRPVQLGDPGGAVDRSVRPAHRSPLVTAATQRHRAVLLVANAAAPYSRGLRVARSLVDAGFDVEIAAPWTTGVTPRRSATVHPDPPLPPAWTVGPVGDRRGPTRPRAASWGASGAWVRRPSSSGLAGSRPRLVGGAATELPPADLYQAFGILAVPVALELAPRGATCRPRRSGRLRRDRRDPRIQQRGARPGAGVGGGRYRERRWVARADALVTVNDPIADHLDRRWRLPARPTVLLNCQARWDPPDPRPD